MPFCADSWYIWQCRYFSDLAPRHRNPSQQINALPVSFISVWCSCRYVSVLFSLPAFKVHYVRLEGGSRIINLLVSGHVGAPPCIYGEVLPNLLWPYHSGPDHPGFVLLQFVAKGDTHMVVWNSDVGMKIGQFRMRSRNICMVIDVTFFVQCQMILCHLYEITWSARLVIYDGGDNSKDHWVV